jgi:hypothetical protein
MVTVIHSPTEWIAHWNRTRAQGRPDLELAGMEEDCIAWSDGLVTPSRAMAEWARARWGLRADAVAVTPYPLGDLEEVARRNAAAAESNGSARRVLFVGRLEPRKGVDTLIGGFAGAVASGADLTLDLAGEDMPDPREAAGRFGAGCLARAPAETSARVSAHGKLPPERVAELQEQAGMAVAPAPMDNFPFSCMEAMARGRLVVGAAAGGVGEMIRDSRDGLLFDPGSERGCAEALCRAASMTPTDAREMRRSAAGRILELCGNGRVVEERLRHYRSAMATRAKRPPARRRTWLVINRGRATEEAVRALTEAAETAGADFAHGWTRLTDGSVLAFSTPRPALLALAAADPGIMAVAADVAGRPDIAWLLTPSGANQAAADGLTLAVTLLSNGARGTVVPEIVAPIADSDSRREPSAAEELAGIHRSRGWRFLQRAYDLLHILRGRGLRRR